MRCFTSMFILGIAVVGSFALGRVSSQAEAEDATNGALRLEVLSKAQSLQTAVGALSSLDDGTTGDARTLIDGQLRSSLAILQAVVPTITLSANDAAVAKGSITDAQSYLKKHGSK